MLQLELTALGLRLVGVYFLTNLMSQLPRWVQMLHELSAGQFGGLESGFGQEQKFVIYLGFFALLISAFVLIFFPTTIAKLISPKQASAPSAITADKQMIQRTAFTILGVYILSWAIPDLIANLLQLWVLGRFPDSNPATSYLVGTDLATTLVEIGIGVYLVFGSTGVIGLIRKFREYGVPK